MYGSVKGVGPKLFHEHSDPEGAQEVRDQVAARVSPSRGR